MMEREKNYFEMIEKAAGAIAGAGGRRPVVGAVLGSGLGGSSFPSAADVKEIPYSSIPGMPMPSVAGHAGKLILMSLEGTECAVLSGRVHLYEGWSALMVAFAVRVLMRLGCRVFVLTNAAGAVNPALRPGSLVLLRDHINLTGEDPTRGLAPPGTGVSFTGLTDLYDPECRELMGRGAREEGLELAEGVYASLKGPCYETPAEIGMLRTMGADLVGMSTVLEAMAVRHGGGRVAAVSCVTNLGAGIEGSRPNHEEVKKIAAESSEKLARLLRRFAGFVRTEPL
jgi:purine-nucleoside phosphorylase